jgi:NAD(P)-dependent dehydrogenase (short-subunit alcohol dehydrogenase family)
MTKKQTILITGATSGIGRDAALYLHERGHEVIACGRNPRALEELRKQGLVALELDVTDKASIEAAARAVDDHTKGRGVDALVNNAGYGLFGPMEMLDEEDVRAQFETNVFGLLAVTRAFLPAMRERGAGRVVNISSVGGRMTFPLFGAYHGTKYAVEAMSDALRMELAQFGVGVAVIEPGYIKTNFTSTTMDLLDKYRDPSSPYAAVIAGVDAGEKMIERFAAPPRAVSRAIEHAIVSRRPRARYVAPWINAFGPMLVGLIPTRLFDWMLRRAFGLTAGRAAASPALPSGA